MGRAAKRLMIVGMFYIMASSSGMVPDVFADDQHAATRAAAPASASHPVDKEIIQANGIVQPRQVFQLILYPGEFVQQCFVSKGLVVDKGDLLLALSNPELDAKRLSIEEKRLAFHQEEALLKKSELDLKFKKERLDRINAKIAEEKRIANDVPGYISVNLERLEEQRALLKEQLTLSDLQMDAQKRISLRYQELATLLDDQDAYLDRMTERLAVRAPFKGKIIFLHPQMDRAGPGEPVCELWDESSFIVRGGILQHQLEYIHEGSVAEITLEFTDHPPAKGIVASIESPRTSPKVDGYPVFEVFIRVTSTASWLRSGMKVSLMIGGQSVQ